MIESNFIATQNYICLDLTKIFNNCGSTNGDTREYGNFNVRGNSYPREEFGNPNNLQSYYKVPFKFPVKNGSKLDNLICLKQEVDIPKKAYKAVHILGACDMGSYEAEVTLECLNGNYFNIPFGLSCWWERDSNPDFGEKTAVICSCLRYRTHDQKNILPQLWLKSLKIESNKIVKKIILPDNPFMHIFAITLEA